MSCDQMVDFGTLSYLLIKLIIIVFITYPFVNMFNILLQMMHQFANISSFLDKMPLKKYVQCFLCERKWLLSMLLRTIYPRRQLHQPHLWTQTGMNESLASIRSKIILQPSHLSLRQSVGVIHL